VIAIRKRLRLLFSNVSGATAIEYGLIVALIAVATIGGMQQLGGGVGGKWGQLANTMNNYMH
jgi:pilus assembly protein Flp/PilA